MNCQAVSPYTRSGDSATTVALRRPMSSSSATSPNEAAGRDRPQALAAGLHPGGALGDHEEADAALALDDHGVARVEAALLGGMRHGLELTVGKPFEQRNLSQCLEAFVGHAWIPRFVAGGTCPLQPTIPNPPACGKRMAYCVGPERCPSWLKERDWKSRNGGFLVRGFESRPLRSLARRSPGGYDRMFTALATTSTPTTTEIASSAIIMIPPMA